MPVHNEIQSTKEQLTSNFTRAVGHMNIFNFTEIHLKNVKQ